jgi:hypothetical protein
MSTLIDLAMEYFDAFSRKDLNTIAVMFDDNITLRDWEISASGKIDVITANKKIFDSVDSISVIPIDMYHDANIVIAELNIIVNDTEQLYVIDVITFDGDKINSIRAYKG